MTVRSFDLNIGEVLSSWEVQHALREIIANALDEQVMSDQADIQIFKEADGKWHIRDYGRGLQIEQFTLGENKEKLAARFGVVGMFGVGLTSALATFHRKKIGVVVRSDHGTFRLKAKHKAGFESITTLHIEYDDKPLPMGGTEFILSGVTDADMAKAKALFMRFADEEVIEGSVHGQILRRREGTARVYIMGVLASEEPNFLFSYNITSLTASMRKRLNRERQNVGRTAYADRVKAILRAATTPAVERALIDQVRSRASGDQRDEMAWVEISQKALNLVNRQSNVVFFTEQQLGAHPNIVDTAKADGYGIVVVSEQQHARLEAQVASGGAEVRTMQAYLNEFKSSFQYRILSLADLSPEERLIYEQWPKIASLAGHQRSDVPPIQISETVRLTADDSVGVWDVNLKSIIIARKCLASIERFAGVLLTEIAHAMSGGPDLSRAFESELNRYLGRIAVLAFIDWTPEVRVNIWDPGSSVSPGKPRIKGPSQ